jgi:mannitol-specific phosphotransferase system IIBC component
MCITDELGHERCRRRLASVLIWLTIIVGGVLNVGRVQLRAPIVASVVASIVASVVASIVASIVASVVASIVASVVASIVAVVVVSVILTNRKARMASGCESSSVCDNGKAEKANECLRDLHDVYERGNEMK